MTEAGSPDGAFEPMRPMVAGQASNRGVWIFAIIAAIGAIALFAALEARRSGTQTGLLSPAQASGEGMIVPPPPLALDDPNAPPAYALPSAPFPRQAQVLVAPPPRAIPRGPSRSPQVIYAPGPSAFQPPPQPQPGVVVADPVYQAPGNAATAAEPGQNGLSRVRAGRFANPGLTIPQGAVMQAVLETALDSTRPGPARAIISRDVRSFDGTRVLVPRGSKLFGEYRADLASGQNRAAIQWTRLMRPDGAIIALDSPSADPLGRAGVKGKVNSHFFARFGNAVLQSILDLGVNYGTSKATGGTVIVGLPNSSVQVNPQAGESVKPTLSVPHGTPVSVFVARDLDFSSVEP